jgi:hypothetical protein
MTCALNISASQGTFSNFDANRAIGGTTLLDEVEITLRLL